MRLDDFREWLRRQPFRPFRFYILEMTAYEVHHPEMVIAHPSTLDLYPPDEEDSAASLPYATIALMHITKLELLTVPLSTHASTHGPL
jgi:hypothetical protein